MVKKLLRRPQVEEMTGLSRSTIYDKIRSGTFPGPVRLGDRAVGWHQVEVEEWIASRSRSVGEFLPVEEDTLAMPDMPKSGGRIRLSSIRIRVGEELRVPEPDELPFVLLGKSRR